MSITTATTKTKRAPKPVVPVHHCPSYTSGVFNISSLPLIVRWAEGIILKERIDGIIACGHSGLLLAGALSYVTRVPVFAVRKKGEQSVAGAPVVTGIALQGPAKRWAFVDDFISSGGTFLRSRNEVKKAKLIKSLTPAAIISYNRHDDESNKWMEVSETDVTYVSKWDIPNAPRDGYKRVRQFNYLTD